MPEDKIAQIKRLLEKLRLELEVRKGWEPKECEWSKGERWGRIAVYNHVIPMLEAILEEPPPMPSQAAMIRELGERVVSLEAQITY